MSGKTLGAAVTAYLATLKTPSTTEAYGKALHPMVTRFGKDAPLADLDPLEVADWLQEQWGGSASATFNLRLRAIRSASQWWREREWVTTDLAGKVRKVRERAVLPAESLTSAEVQAILDQCNTRYALPARNKALIMLLYRSGLRVSEVLSLRPSDVDFGSHSLRLLGTKSGKAQTRGFHPSADDALKLWIERRAELGIGNHGRKLFCTQAGGPLSDQYVRSMVKGLADKAGVDKRVHPHGFRHTFAKELREAGVPLEVIQKLLGHSSLRVTQIYLDSLTNSEAVGALSAVLLPGDAAAIEEEPQSADPDLALVRDILSRPGAVSAMADIARVAADRASRRRRSPEREDPAETTAREQARERSGSELPEALEQTARASAGMTREEAAAAAQQLRSAGASLREISQAISYSVETTRKMTREQWEG
jgi:site-specific recombinase XerD